MTGSIFNRTGATALCLTAFLFCGCRTTPKPTPSTAKQPEITPASKYQVYLIIDDAGQRLSQTERFLNLPVPLTIAVLPGLPATQSSAEAISRQSTDKQLMLHQPMQAMNSKLDPGPGAIFSDTPIEEIPDILRKNMAQLPGAKGMNNHMGSQITQDRERMNAVMAFCETNDLFFVDSFTTAASIAGEVAQEHGVPTAQQYIFLDNDHNEEAIIDQFQKGLRIAYDRGFVVMIGHVWSAETAQVIARMAQPAQDAGYSFHLIDDVFEKTAQPHQHEIAKNPTHLILNHP